MLPQNSEQPFFIKTPTYNEPKVKNSFCGILSLAIAQITLYLCNLENKLCA